MISKFVKEQKRYTTEELQKIFECTFEKKVVIIKKLKEYGVLKSVKATKKQINMSDLVSEDVEITSVENEGNEFLYVFTFVGIIIVFGCVLKCYPKYINTILPKQELKQIIKVLKKYGSDNQKIQIYNENEKNNSFNILSLMIYLLDDYNDNGSYTNTQSIVEINGTGEVMWERTINETFAYLKNNRPYYIDVFTQKRINDEFDYFKRLHESIVSCCSKELKSSDLLDFFDISPVEVSDEELDVFGNKEDILYRIQSELNLQFNTRKQILLKALYMYIAGNASLSSSDCFTVYGTNSFNLVWEKVCGEVFDNQLNALLGALPIVLSDEYNPMDSLISIIEKPKWSGWDQNGSRFKKMAKDTLVPDIITINKVNNLHQFIIFDAKYYTIQLDKEKELRGQPGISDITKQYLYQLAYRKFVDTHNIQEIKNCFLMPTEEKKIVIKGNVSLGILEALYLEEIQIRLLPATDIYTKYLNNEKMNIELLRL